MARRQLQLKHIEIPDSRSGYESVNIFFVSSDLIRNMYHNPLDD